MIIHTNYQGSRPCGFRQEDFLIFSLDKPVIQVIPGVGPFWPQEHNLNILAMVGFVVLNKKILGDDALIS